MVPHSAGRPEQEALQNLILPRVQRAGWLDEQVIQEYPLAAGTVVAHGGSSRVLGDGFADIVLEATPGTPVAVIEAKHQHRTPEDAIQQAIRYAQQLDVPLAYGTNGTRIIERNLRTGTETEVPEFAAPAMAWAEYVSLHRLDEANAGLIAQPFNRNRLTSHGDVMTPRHYQVTAVNRVLSAIARGQRRVLLLMATGTGKTFTAMQIVAKLRSYESAVRPDRNYRVLYLADRDTLLTQPMRKDFIPAFGQDPLQRVLGKVDSSREIYFASYQAMIGTDPDSPPSAGSSIFEAFRPDFFDLVIVDECHRGSAAADSAWRAVLDYFTSAIHLGLTATPRDDTVHSYDYFGNPVFEYSLRDGIADGYLAPYTVRRVVLSPDAQGWEPSPGELDRYGAAIPENTYSTRDFERVVSLLARTELAARHLSMRLCQDPTARAVVFCVDIEHADDMRRALIAENADLVASDPEWVVRIVGVEGERTRLLEGFTDPEATSPVVATTSRLLSTGVDIEDLKFVVLFRPIGSMIEFKQIIGRGTRLYPDKDKTSFEIVDYVGATAHFSDPTFDGYPVHITVEEVDDHGAIVGIVDPTDGPGPEDPGVEEPEPPFVPHDPPGPVPDPPPGPTPPSPGWTKYYVDDGTFTIESEARLVPDRSNGGIVLTEYGQFVRSRIRAVGTEAELTRTWASASSRHQLQNMLASDGIDLAELSRDVGADDVDPLDVLFQLAWNAPVQTRRERVAGVRARHHAEIEAMTTGARNILEGLLQRYEAYGVSDLESAEVFRLDPLRRLGSPLELAIAAGGGDRLRAQLDLVQEWLYA